MASSPPAPTDPMASTIMGHVMVPGDSCGCGSSFSRRFARPGTQRFSPKNVISITRVM